MDQRREFVRLAMQEGVNRRELCRRFGIHPDTGYKWLGRWQADQEIADRSRRPHSSPRHPGASRLDLTVREIPAAVEIIRQSTIREASSRDFTVDRARLSRSASTF
jgi:transposase-like protein